MSLLLRWRIASVAVVLLVGAANTTDAQVNPRDLPIVAQPQQRFDSGQDIQPIFEGWSRNDDGSYLFHFGYLNRNYREQPNIPIGSANYFSPSEQDRNQPTYFYPRTQRYQFAVPMPASTGSTRIAWPPVADRPVVTWQQPRRRFLDLMKREKIFRPVAAPTRWFSSTRSTTMAPKAMDSLAWAKKNVTAKSLPSTTFARAPRQRLSFWGTWIR